MILLGWASSDSKSLDLVVAAACFSPLNCSNAFPDSFLEAMLSCATNRLPSELQGRATLSVIGECIASSDSVSEHIVRDNRNSLSSALIGVKVTDYEEKRPADCCFWSQGEPGCSNSGDEYPRKVDRWRKGRLDVGAAFPGNNRPRNGFRIGQENNFEGSIHTSFTSNVWIELLIQPSASTRNLVDVVPILRSLRFQGSFCIPHFHFILYEQPKLASHHFSIRGWNFISGTCHVQDNCLFGQDSHQSRPEWVADLEKNREAPDIDLVVLQLNCAVAAERAVEDLLASLDTPCKRLSLTSILRHLYCHLIAATVALLASIFYVMVQAGCYLLNIWPFVHVNAFSAKLLKHTHRNIRIRCYQLTGWPVVLLWRGCGRDQPNIAAAHRAALVRHSTWSAIIFDLVFGIFAGAFFLCYHASISQFVRGMVRTLTDDILRTGCIWLMGVPAGFKLNNELAGTLGIISLNVIQVWSTLLYLVKPVFGIFLHTLAISGMLLGVTVPAAMIADVLFLATLHISALHQLVAFLYSNQLQALAALWRLFRGRKRNYLRGRIDTYDYSVEQHVVGSLMFTPLLLLLPTTSVFYIFFTILYTSLSVLRFLLQILIAFLHCFPYAQVAIWLVQPRRFPSGIWLENLPLGRVQEVVLSSKVQRDLHRQSFQEKDSSARKAGQILISNLGVKTASLGELLLPYVRRLGGGLTWSSCALCLYKIFSGERWPSSVELGTPALPPWTSFPVRRFWWLCYDAVLASI